MKAPNMIILERVKQEIFGEIKKKKNKKVNEKDIMESFFTHQLKEKNFQQEETYIKYLRDVTKAYEVITGEDRNKDSLVALNKIADPHLIACGLHLRSTLDNAHIFIVSEEKRAPSDNGVKNLHKVKIPNVCEHETIQLTHLHLAEFIWQVIVKNGERT